MDLIALDKRNMDSTLRGGKRSGAGRKKGITFKEPTVPYTVRIIETVLEELKERYGDQLPDKIKESIYKLNELEKS
ncbi:hypothetical protein N180_18090 [Pedobacter antarcticus 4BY]|uniref:Uncharacterized protein n=2 Tax=Pedobacter antarcticus TaxID=34086 RepID=A0A081PFX0_9SPHI|nr:hypothetical protein N180_18090 [Pedobacter antarcticus 4BY]